MKKIKEIAFNRLKRECEKNNQNLDFLQGYNQAINDLLYDYDGTVLLSFEFLSKYKIANIKMEAVTDDE